MADKNELKAQYKEREIVGGICALRHETLGRMWLEATSDVAAYKNRFEFSQKTDLCPHPSLRRVWETDGASAFSVEVIDTLKKDPAQTDREFLADLKELKKAYEDTVV